MYNQWTRPQITAMQLAALQPQMDLTQDYCPILLQTLPTLPLLPPLPAHAPLTPDMTALPPLMPSITDPSVSTAFPLSASPLRIPGAVNDDDDDRNSFDEDDDRKRTIFCGNLDDRVTEELLYEVFLQAGPIEAVRIPKDANGSTRCFGFVTYVHLCSVPYALQLYKGLTLFRRPINIKFQQSNSAPSTPVDYARHLIMNTPVVDSLKRRSDDGHAGSMIASSPGVGGSNSRYDNNALRRTNFAVAFHDSIAPVNQKLFAEDMNKAKHPRTNEQHFEFKRHESSSARDTMAIEGHEKTATATKSTTNPFRRLLGLSGNPFKHEQLSTECIKGRSPKDYQIEESERKEIKLNESRRRNDKFENVSHERNPRDAQSHLVGISDRFRRQNQRGGQRRDRSSRPSEQRNNSNRNIRNNDNNRNSSHNNRNINNNNQTNNDNNKNSNYATNTADQNNESRRNSNKNKKSKKNKSQR